jgi:adenosylmethionine-8-amino-7-oxononanoate aminotransferase
VGNEYADESRAGDRESEWEAAAFIFEPMSGATLGAVIHHLISREGCGVCRQHGVARCRRSQLTGMGRTGRNFAVEHWNVSPDILVNAKVCPAIAAPSGAVIASRKVVDAIANGSERSCTVFTYNAHPSRSPQVDVVAIPGIAKAGAGRRLKRRNASQGPSLALIDTLEIPA